MAYHYDGIAKTQMGKIIYKRKKHVMDSRDLKRLIVKLGVPDDSEGLYNWLAASKTMLMLFHNVENGAIRDLASSLSAAVTTFMELEENFPGFSGGDFGGGGASGSFLLPLDVWAASDATE